MGFWTLSLNADVGERIGMGALVSEWAHLVQGAVWGTRPSRMGVGIREMKLAWWERARLGPGGLLC